MSHYVCKGDCATTSEQPGVCEADVCQNKGQAYEMCECVDGGHAAPAVA